jgi:hypothetical protein
MEKATRRRRPLEKMLTGFRVVLLLRPNTAQPFTEEALQD